MSIASTNKDWSEDEQREILGALSGKRPVFRPLPSLEIFQGRKDGADDYLVLRTDVPQIYRDEFERLRERYDINVYPELRPHVSILRFDKKYYEKMKELLPEINAKIGHNLKPFTATYHQIWTGVFPNFHVVKVSESLKHLKPLFYEDLEDWSGDFVRYTNHEQPFIAKKQWHQDPAGVYFFPKEFKPSGSWHLTNKYLMHSQLKPGAKVLDIAKLSEKDMLRIYQELGIDPKPIMEPSQYASRAEKFYRGIRDRYSGKQVKFANDIRKLGYDAIFDDTGAIHNAEKQLIVLNPAAMKVTDLVPLKKGTDFTKEMIEIVKKQFSDWHLDEEKWRTKRDYGQRIPELRLNYSKGDVVLEVHISYYQDTSRNAPHSFGTIIYSHSRKDPYESFEKFDRSIRTDEPQEPELEHFAKMLKEYADKMNKRAEATAEATAEAKTESDDEIGSGEFAISTDKTGKFWGNAGAGGVFFAEDTKRYLLSYRSKYVNEPHTWGVWGGKLDEGETPEQAIRREIEEETGYKGDYQLKLIHVFRKGDFTFHDYLIIVPKEFKPRLDWETEDYGWFKKDEFPKPLHFGLKDFMPKLEEKGIISETKMPQSITKNPDKKGIIHLIKSSVSNAIRVLMDKKTGDIWVWAEEEGPHIHVAPLVGVDINDSIRGQISAGHGTVRGAITSMFPTKSDIVSFIKAFPFMQSLIDLKGTVYFDKTDGASANASA